MALHASSSESRLARAWFSAALTILLLLGLPGMVILALHLLGKGPATDLWLQEHWHLGSHWFLTVWAGVLLLLVPPLIILLYFLKLKRRPLQVPSTFLWRKSIEDLHVNSLFQWLRNNILLLLQLLTILVLIYAVLAPQLHGQMTPSGLYILMIDNSASMAATDVWPSRLDAAKVEAIRTIDAHAANNDRGMLIVFAATAELVQLPTSDADLLKSQVRAIAQTHQPTRIEEALSLADSRANPNRPTDADTGKTSAATEGTPVEVHLFSDGGFPDVPDFARGNLHFDYHPIGEPAERIDNLGIVGFSATRDDRDASDVYVLVRVANCRAQAARVRVRLEIEASESTASPPDQTLTLEGRTPGADGVPGLVPEAVAAFTLHGIDDRADVVLHARLLDEQGAALADHFALDNDAWLVVGVVRKARVLVVSRPIPALKAAFGDERNPVLHSFFDQAATRRVSEVDYLRPEDLKDDAKYGKRVRNGDYDLVIFDRHGPERVEDMPRANTWFIGCLPPTLNASNLSPRDATRVTMNRHPLFRNVSLQQDVAVVRPQVYKMVDSDVPPHTPRLLETEGDTAILFAVDRQSFTDLVMTFPFFADNGQEMTKWYLSFDFPTFLRNVVYTLGHVGDAAAEDVLRPGQPKTIRPDVAVDTIEIRDPQRSPRKVERGTRAEFLFGGTDRLGVYDVSWNGQKQRSFAVNLLDVEESSLVPRPRFKLGNDDVVAGAVRDQPLDLWKWLVLAALLLLVLEWYIYNRRVAL